VKRLGRTAKEIATEIDEELIAVKQMLAHGEFKPWVAANCTFTVQHARRYMKVADVKRNTRVRFDQANSIREVLDLKDAKPEPKPVHRATTLNDLRKVELLRNLRDDPGATERELQPDGKSLLHGHIGRFQSRLFASIYPVPNAPEGVT
jgi:hypothetical protein